MCRIVQDVRTCTIRHTKRPGECVGLYRISRTCLIWHIPRVQRNVSDCTGCLNLSNPTHQGTLGMCRIVQDVRTCLQSHQGTRSLGMCRIVQDVRTCTIRHIPLGPLVWRISTGCQNPVQIRHIPLDQGNVSDCTGCQNLYNPTQGTRGMCRIVQDQNLSNPTHQGTRGMCRIVQDVRTCLIRHTKGPLECVGLYRMSESCLIRHTKGPGECVGLYRMSEPV